MRILCLALLALTTIQGFTEDDDGKPKVDKQAEEVLRKTLTFYSGLKSARFLLTTTTKMSVGGLNMDMKAAIEFSIKWPNQFAIVAKEGPTRRSCYCDGKTLVTWDVTKDEYTEQPAPKSIHEAFAEGVVSVENIPLLDVYFMGSLFAENGYEYLTMRAKAVRYAGSEILEGIKVHRIVVTGFIPRKDIFIKEDAPPLLTRVIPYVEPLDVQDGDGKKPMKLDIVVTYSEWKLDLPLPDEEFVFKPGPDSLKVDRFFRRNSRFVSDPPIGKAIPQLGLKTEAGESFDFSSHKDKDVILVHLDDLSETEKNIEMLGEIAVAYKGKGVVCYAVPMDLIEGGAMLEKQLDERRQVLKNQLAAKQLPVTLIRDKKRRITNEYGFGIKWLMIGKDGTLKAAISRKLSDVQVLRDAIDRVLAGTAVPAELSQEDAPKAGARE
jgi:outer membrane lipoprotein-sorting protein